MQALTAALEAGIHEAAVKVDTLLSTGAVGASIGAIVERGAIGEPGIIVGAAVGILLPAAVAFARGFAHSIANSTAPPG